MNFGPVAVAVLLLQLTTRANLSLAGTLEKPPDPEGSSDIFAELSALETRASSPGERVEVLRRLHQMWASEDPLRRPLIAYLMCQYDDRSMVDSIAEALFAGEYDTGRRLEPDGSAAGGNATDAALRTLILYGTSAHHGRLVQFLSLCDDPLRKGGELCDVLWGLASPNDGPGLPPGFPKQGFPIQLVISCLDYEKQVATEVDAHEGLWVEVRGSDYAAQTIQAITDHDFGHRLRGSLQERDRAIAKIRTWWATQRTANP